MPHPREAAPERATGLTGACAAPAHERRRTLRVAAEFPIEYAGPVFRGSGTVHDISLTGALIVGAQPQLVAGGEVSLRFSFFPDSLPLEIEANIVRETETGFAVAFRHLKPRVKGACRIGITKLAALYEDESDTTLLRTDC